MGSVSAHHELVPALQRSEAGLLLMNAAAILNEKRFLFLGIDALAQRGVLSALSCHTMMI